MSAENSDLGERSVIAPTRSIEEIRLAAETIRTAVRDGIDELPDWLRVGFLSEEVAPMLDELAREVGS
jgi:hypothetical protein